MTIYFIRAGEDGPVKIGTTEDLAARMRDLQVGNHEELRLVRTIEGGAGHEQFLHRRFGHLRIRGEWFRWHDDMLADFDFADAPRFPRLNADPVVHRAVGCIGSVRKLAELLLIKPESIYSWRRVPALRAHRIAELTGIPCHELRPDIWPEPVA